MEFLKDNWAKIIISCLMLVAAAIYIIYLFHIDAKFHMFKEHAILIAGIAFFAGSAAYLICSMFDQDKNWAKYILLGVGVVCTVFAGAYFIHIAIGDGWKFARAFGINWFEYLALTHAFTFLVVFGLIPLIHGIKKVCCGGVDTKVKKTAAAPRAAAK